MLSWLRRRVDAVEAPYRRERAKWKIALRWTTGAVTDPHTKLSSAARIVGIGTAVSLWTYTTLAVLTSQRPDPWVVGSHVTLVTAALALRARSTQEGKVPLAARRADVAAAAPASEAILGPPPPPAAGEAIVGASAAPPLGLLGLLIARRRDNAAGVESAV